MAISLNRLLYPVNHLSQCFSKHVKPYLISMVVSKSFGKTLPDFVNGYRLREAERLLTCATFNHYSVEGIAFECGYSTPSAFYAQFKKEFNRTPREYRAKKETI